jgi:transposase
MLNIEPEFFNEDWVALTKVSCGGIGVVHNIEYSTYSSESWLDKEVFESFNLRPELRQRLEIILRANQGQSQAEICANLGCAKETARYWMVIAKSGQMRQWCERPIGRPKVVNQDYLSRLRELVTDGPRRFGYAFQRWTARSLSIHLANELGIQISDRHISRLLKQMGLSTRPEHSKKVLSRQLSPGLNIQIDDLQPPDPLQLSH